MDAKAMSMQKPKGETPHDGTDFGKQMVRPVDNETVREVVEKARSLPLHDHRVVLETHLDGLVGQGQLEFLNSSAVLSSLLFMAEHKRSCYTPAEKREFDRGILDVSLEYRPVSVEEGDVFVHFDIKCHPQTRAIRRMGVHVSYTADMKRRLIKEGRIEW
jgi:hypothetical protein